MKRPWPNKSLKTLLITFTLFLVAVCNGPAQTNSLVHAVGSTPTDLARLIARADHIIVTNSSNPHYRGFSLSISGDRVGKIVAAVSAAKRNQAETNSEWEWEMQFFGVTDRLAVVNFQGRMFLAENGEYADNSGVLDKLSREILDRTTPPGSR